MRTRMGWMLAGLLLAGSALAGGLPAGGDRGDGMPLADIKRHLLESHAARLRILQQGEACIAAARDRPALRVCLRRERQQMHEWLPPRRPRGWPGRSPAPGMPGATGAGQRG